MFRSHFHFQMNSPFSFTHKYANWMLLMQIYAILFQLQKFNLKAEP